MSSSRKMVTTVILTVFALGFVSGQNKYNSNKDQLLGGWRDAKEDDKSVLEALQFATAEYNRGNNGDYITKVHRIIRFRKQVVAGMKYAMDVEVITTPCSDFESTSENCPTQKKRCSFQVLSVPWMHSTKLTNKSCRN
ncbi:cystatin-C [Xenopus laevis]|nr:cystatin-C [Xenopus laevis]